MKHRFPVIVLISFSLVVLISCRKPIEQGKTIFVSGIVFDSVKNKPLPNATLYLFGANQTFYGIYYSNGPFASTTSDVNGRFSITYTAEGQSVDYGVAVGDLQYGGYNYGNQSNYIVDVLKPMYKLNYSTNISNAVISARELNYTKIRLKVLSNPYDTFMVKIYPAQQTTYIKSMSFDTTIYIRHLPNSQNIIHYGAQKYFSDSGFVYREVIDTITPNLPDTISLSKTINNIYSMPRR